MLTMDDIIRDPHPTLRKVAKEVSLPPSDDEKAILKSMLEFVINSQDEKIAREKGLRSAVGLAAPQINVSKRMIVVHAKDEKGRQHSYALFNPKIISHSVEKTYLIQGEGCLSVDKDIPGYVPRYARITVTGTDLDGNEVKLRLRGYIAVIFQHEIDHLNGILFYDHINKEDPFAPIENAVPIGGNNN